MRKLLWVKGGIACFLNGIYVLAWGSLCVNFFVKYWLDSVSILTFKKHITDTYFLKTMAHVPEVRGMCLLFILCLSASFFVLKFFKKGQTRLYFKLGLIAIATVLIALFPAFHTSVKSDSFLQVKDIEDFIPPKEKKNLIVVFAESLEASYQNTQVFSENLIPKLSLRTKEHLSFSGFEQLEGTDWTLGAHVSMLCGIPVPWEKGGLERLESLCVPKILKSYGYNTLFMKGATLLFAGTMNFARDAGFNIALGRDELFQQNRATPADDGFRRWVLNITRDQKMFPLFKQEILALSQQDKPFMAVLTTSDTHFPNGYFPVGCEKKYGNMADILKCSDNLVDSFLSWCEQQPFFKDTVIVVIGDHLSMKNDIWDKLTLVKKREIFNLFINTPVPKNVSRKFSSFDIAPSLLQALGFQWQGFDLGFGVSLFDVKQNKTLIEQAKEPIENLINQEKEKIKSVIFKINTKKY